MREPGWMNAGYGVDSYEAECNICGTVARLEFDSDDEYHLLTPKYKDEIDQEQLFAYVYFWTWEKLRRMCDCSKEERDEYEQHRLLGL